MTLSQERATLYDTLQRSPHLTLVYKDRDGVDHLVFKDTWDGWRTPCERDMRDVRLIDVHYGRPTCFECFGEDNPADVGRHGRHAIKLFAERKGQHWYVVMWMGALNETMVHLGGVTMLDYEWREFAAAVVLGGLAIGMRVIIEREEC